MEQHVDAPEIAGPWSNYELGQAYDQHRQDRWLGLDAHRWRGTRKERAKASHRARRLEYGTAQYRKGIAGAKHRGRHLYGTRRAWSLHLPRYKRRISDEERRARMWGDYNAAMGYE